MADTIQTDVRRDADGRDIGETIIRQPKRRGGGFGLGALVGAAAAIIIVIAFAMSQGSFRQAGSQADHVTSQAQDQAGHAASSTGAAIENTGDRMQNGADRSN